jgi:hypothetical protein
VCSWYTKAFFDKENFGPGTEAHAYKSQLLGRWRSGGSQFGWRPAWAKKAIETPSQQKLSMVVRTYNPSYTGAIGRGSQSEAGSSQRV